MCPKLQQKQLSNAASSPAVILLRLCLNLSSPNYNSEYTVGEEVFMILRFYPHDYCLPSSQKRNLTEQQPAFPINGKIISVNLH